jgi:GTP-binding protein
MKKPESKTQLPLVSLVGRPNVGKSTLFNRLIGRRIAIVDDTPGVTRDRIFGRCRIGDVTAYLVDTGGISSYADKSEMDRNVEKQVLMTFEDSAVVALVVDAAAGLMPEDEYAADVLRRYKRPVVVVANKSDNDKLAEAAMAEFFKLGFGEPVPVSALHGINIDLLRERIEPLLPPAEETAREGRPLRFCVAGRPNVGKSSIVNAILGEERCVVSAIPGTTRDRVDTEFTRDGRPFVIGDTAGIKRHKTRMDKLEFYSSTRARRAIVESDVAVLVLDAKEGILEGDKKVAGDILEMKKGLIVVVNKIDLIETPKFDRFVEYIAREAPFLRHSPVVFMSALEREGIGDLLDTLVEVRARMTEMLPIELLRNVIYDVRALYSPKSRGSRIGEIKGVLHDRANPPRIIIRVNDTALFPPAYVRLIENRIRTVFNLRGVPLDLTLTAPSKKKSK